MLGQIASQRKKTTKDRDREANQHGQLISVLVRAVDALNQSTLFLQAFTSAVMKKGLVTDAEIKAAFDEANQKLADASRVRSQAAGTDGGNSGSSGGESSNPSVASGDPSLIILFSWQGI